MDGHVRFMWVMGSTWFPAMLASQELGDRVSPLVKDTGHQPCHVDRDHLIETYKARIDAGGMVLVNSNICPVDPLNMQIADIVLPAAGWDEEDRTRCNAERRLRLYSRISDPPGDAKPDWWAIAQFVRKMGVEGFDWVSSADILEDAARFLRNGVLSYNGLHVRAQKEGRGTRDEVWITRGRVNETWQSGFDDRRKPYLAKRWPRPYIFVHPRDVEPRGIVSGDLVEGYNDTVYVQSGRPVGVGDGDLGFSSG